jgi:hypothetical protein
MILLLLPRVPPIVVDDPVQDEAIVVLINVSVNLLGLDDNILQKK